MSLAAEEGSRGRPIRPLRVRVLTGDLQEVVATGVDGQTLQINIPPRAPTTGGLPDSVDGRFINSDFPGGARAVQANPTGFGDNLSELNALYAQPERDGLRIAFTGNLEPNFNGLCLFIDTDPGGPLGQQNLNFNGAPTPPQGPNTLSGLTLASGFRPDMMYFINNGAGIMYADRFDMFTGGVSKTYLGRTTINSGQAQLEGGSNPNGVRIAYDNDNRLGVTDFNADPAAALAVDRGLEILLPWSELGFASPFPCGEVRVLGFVMAPNGFISNQSLPPMPGGTPNLGFDRGGFASSALQNAGFEPVPFAGAADIANSSNLQSTPDGLVDLTDFSVYLTRWSAAASAADITADGACDLTSPDGAITLSDFSCFVTQWAAGCPSP